MPILTRLSILYSFQRTGFDPFISLRGHSGVKAVHVNFLSMTVSFIENKTTKLRKHKQGLYLLFSSNELNPAESAVLSVARSRCGSEREICPYT